MKYVLFALVCLGLSVGFYVAKGSFLAPPVQNLPAAVLKEQTSSSWPESVQDLPKNPSSSIPDVASDASILPRVVLDKIKELELDCRLDGDMAAPLKTKAEDIVSEAHLRDPHLRDFILSDSSVECEAGVSYRSGNGGIGLLIFSELLTKEVVPSFDEMVFDFSLRDDKTLVAQVGGGYCEPVDPEISRADMESCWVKFLWRPETHQFVTVVDDQSTSGRASD